MDSDVQKILDLSEQMKECFKKLERRRAVTASQRDAIAGAADMFRFFERVDLSRLRAAFDREYAEELERINRIAKTK